MVAAIKWLKSLYPSEWCGVGEDWGVTPKPLEIVITLPVYTTPITTLSPPLLSEKQKDGIWFRDRLDLCVRICAFMCPHVCGDCVFVRARTFMCVPVLHRDRGVATSFTRSSHVRKPLSVRRDDRRVALAMDGALQMKKINKDGAIVSEATRRISAGVWGQSAARNSLSIGKHICHIRWQNENPNGSFYKTKLNLKL